MSVTGVTNLAISQETVLRAAAAVVVVDMVVEVDIAATVEVDAMVVDIPTIVAAAAVVVEIAATSVEEEAT